MGAWGFNQFENDGALDWLGDFSENQDFAVIDELFDEVLESSASNSFQEGADQALVACEIIAGSMGNLSKSFPQYFLDKTLAKGAGFSVKIIDFERLKTKLNPVLRVKALKVLKVITDGQNSYLREAWEESGNFEKWKVEVSDLEKRLMN